MVLTFKRIECQLISCSLYLLILDRRQRELLVCAVIYQSLSSGLLWVVVLEDDRCQQVDSVGEALLTGDVGFWWGSRCDAVPWLVQQSLVFAAGSLRLTLCRLGENETPS